MNGPDEGEGDSWWVALARELLARTARLDQPDNPVRINADADRSDEPQGRSYNAEQ